jgi:hypothetical protein
MLVDPFLLVLSYYRVVALRCLSRSFGYGAEGKRAAVLSGEVALPDC